ncbi:MAG: ABC transporter permease [SAR202 cluster bacterium]|nr:ABC transporter permease [SAR202 cluster bacterium]
MTSSTRESLTPIEGGRATSGMSGPRRAWKFLRRYPLIPAFFLTVLVIAAAIGPIFAPYPVAIGDLNDRLLAPFSRGVTGNYYVLGTDHAGRDVLSRLLTGSRITLSIAGLSLCVGIMVGTTLGVVSGYFGGMTDEVITRMVDIWYALPFLLIALIMTFIFGKSLAVLLIVLALISWSGFVRIIRAQVLVLREMDYVDAARIAGAGDRRILLKHIVPGIVNTATVIASINVGGLILAEATLSFVGAGIQPPTPAWGVMVSNGRDYLQTAWWLVAMPGLSIFMVVISLNFLGDWLRDRLDPTLRQID